MDLAEHLTLRRDAGPPASHQLAFRIAAAIGEGRLLREGDRLPGARRLASRLGIHRNTVLATYRQLAARGLVESRPGSGTYVRPAGGRAKRGAPEEPLPSSRFRRLLAAHRRAARRRLPEGGSPTGGRGPPPPGVSGKGEVEQGLDRDADVASLAAAFRAWSEAAAGPEVRLVEDAPDLRNLKVAELRLVLPARRVSGIGSGAVPRDPAWWSRGPVVCDPAELAATAARAPAWAALFDLPAADAELGRALSDGPGGTVVLLVTDSGRMAERAGHAAAVLRGRTLSLAHVRPSSEGAVARVGRILPVAHFVLADLPARTCLREIRTRARGGARWRSLWAQSPAALRELGRYLGSGDATGTGGS